LPHIKAHNKSRKIREKEEISSVEFPEIYEKYGVATKNHKQEGLMR